MWVGRVARMLLLAMVILGPQQASSQTPGTQGVQKKADPTGLIIRLKNTSVEELRKLTFLELNLLKNAVYASKGYVFAEDRPWLNQAFCEKRYRNVKKGRIATGRAAVNDWMAKLRGQARWDLDAYEFPPCKEGEALDADQMKALANIRVALFKKIDALGAIKTIDETLDSEINGLQKQGEFAWILGKAVPLCDINYCFQDSTRRELHGYNRLMKLIKNVEQFDTMELLGLYTGDILFIKSVIEAKYGKSHDGVLSWEISQLVGITERKADYDPKKLPVSVQVIIQMLDDVTEKILRSDLQDAPASLKGKSIEFLNPYNGGAC